MGNPFSQSITVTATIKAPRSSVWKVLTDFEQYGEWNSFTPSADVAFYPGGKVHLEAHMGKKGKPWRLNLQVYEVVDGHSFSWGMHALFPLQAIRHQRLEEIDAKTTRYISHETFRGPLVPLVLWIYRTRIIAGIEAVAQGLGEEVEKIR
ncbi:MAG: SRPBCC domain-containing protein [Bacteroidota bacterium]